MSDFIQIDIGPGNGFPEPPECPGHPDDGEFNGPIGETFYCDGSCQMGGPTPVRSGAKTAAVEEEVAQAALDLSLNDCQMWDNLPQLARDNYLREAREETIPDHDCDANAVPYVGDGALGHGWECGVCGGFLQAG